MLIQARPHLFIQVASDLHLPNWRHHPPFVPHPLADILILAGDLCNGPPLKEELRWLKNLPSTYWPAGIFMVLGNHDYYKRRLEDAVKNWKDALSYTRIRLLQREVVQVGSYRIAGCTLWTDFDRGSPLVMLLAPRQIIDYRAIWAGDRLIQPEDILQAHQGDLRFLMEQSPGDDTSPLIVVTHHAPSWKSLSPRFQGSAMNPLFASALEDQIATLSPTLWIHGHTHAICDYMIGQTRVVCAPVGYPGEELGNSR